MYHQPVVEGKNTFIYLKLISSYLAVNTIVPDIYFNHGHYWTTIYIRLCLGSVLTHLK
jgi:hypothetical protein